jgi:hypothetical protein
MRHELTLPTTTFNFHKFYVLPTQCISVFCVDFRTNSDYFPVQRQLIGFYNRDGMCLQRGTDWAFKCSGLRLCHLQHKLIGFYNRDGMCLLRGTDSIFILCVRKVAVLKANKVNLFVSSVLVVFWYHSPNILDTPHIWSSL